MKKSLYYKDLLGFIVDLITLIIYAVSGVFLIIPYVKNYMGQPLLLIPIILILIFTTVRLLKSVITNILFEIEHVSLDLNTKTITESNNKLHNFDKIIPSTRILKLINSELIRQYRKWSKDISPIGAELWINVNDTNMSYSLTNSFYSYSKKIIIQYSSSNLSRPKKNVIEGSKMTFDVENRFTKPFFINKHWRSAVLDSLSNTETEIIGREFSVCFGNMGENLYIYILPDYKKGVNKSFTYFLKKNILHEKFNGKIIYKYAQLKLLSPPLHQSD